MRNVVGNSSVAHAAALVMLDGIIRRQDTTLALRFVTWKTVCQVHADRDAWHFWACQPREEQSRQSVQPCAYCCHCHRLALSPSFQPFVTCEQTGNKVSHPCNEALERRKKKEEERRKKKEERRKKKEERRKKKEERRKKKKEERIRKKKEEGRRRTLTQMSDVNGNKQRKHHFCSFFSSVHFLTFLHVFSFFHFFFFCHFSFSHFSTFLFSLPPLPSLKK